MAEKDLIDALLSGRPYFGPTMRALQGPPIRHKYFAAIVQFIANSEQLRPIRALEIGSWAGASAVTWAKAIQKQGHSGRVTCVDLWQPYFDLTVEQESHYREMSEAAKKNKIFNLFLHNIRAANVSDVIDYLNGNARDVLPTLPSEKFDIVYIDGSHMYEDVRSDIRNAKRLIREGGIICGDDLELQKDDLDEREQSAAVELNKDYVYSHKADKHYHPGVTEAVAIEFGEVSSWEGVWAMRKHGSQWEKVDLNAETVDIPEHIKTAAEALELTQAAEVVLLGSTQDFNLVKAKNQFLAVAKQLGPTQLFAERLGERELAPLLFTGESLEKVREKAMAWEARGTQPVADLLRDTAGYNLLRIGKMFLAVAKQLGPTQLFAERLGERELAPLLFTGESLEQVREKAMAWEASSTQPVADLLGDTAGYNLLRVGKMFLAVAKQLGPTQLFAERLGERELAPLLFTGESLEKVREKAMAWEASSAQPVPEVLGDTAGYNLMTVGETFLAVAKSLGPTNILLERLGERELSPVLLMGDTLEEVRNKAIALEPKVELVEEIGAYNVVKAGDRFIAIARELGPVNLFRERLGERDLPPFILVATDSAALRRRICEIDRNLT